MARSKQRSWIGNSGPGSLDYQKTIFTCLVLLDDSVKNFAGLGWLNEDFDRLRKKNALT